MITLLCDRLRHIGLRRTALVLILPVTCQERAIRSILKFHSPISLSGKRPSTWHLVTSLGESSPGLPFPPRWPKEQSWCTHSGKYLGGGIFKIRLLAILPRLGLLARYTVWMGTGQAIGGHPWTRRSGLSDLGPSVFAIASGLCRSCLGELLGTLDFSS